MSLKHETLAHYLAVDVFRTWLAGLPSSQLVGASRMSEACPVALYVSERMRADGYQIGLTSVGRDEMFVVDEHGPWPTMPLPIPVALLVRALDRDGRGRLITAGEALARLDEVLR